MHVYTRAGTIHTHLQSVYPLTHIPHQSEAPGLMIAEDTDEGLMKKQMK